MHHWTYCIPNDNEIPSKTQESSTGPINFPVIGGLHTILLSKLPVHETWLKMTKTYGNVFYMKMGVLDVIVLNDYQTIHDAFTHPNIIDRPTAGIDFIEDQFEGGRVMAGASGLLWKELRRLLVSLFREFGINKTRFECVILEETEPFIKEVSKFNGDMFDPSELTSNAVTNIICGVTIGNRFDYQSSEFQSLLKLFIKTIKAADESGAVAMFPFLKYIPYPPIKEAARVLRELLHWFKDTLTEHQNNYNEENITDIMYGWLRENKKFAAYGDKEKLEIFTDKNMLANILDVFFAGSETTSTTLTWAYLYLCQNLEVQKKCQDELDDVIGRSRMPMLADRDSLNYVKAMIAEVQRLANVLPISIPHTPSVDTKLFGFTLPKGCTVVSNLQSVMTDPKIWPEPEKFKPERHLSSDGKFIRPNKLIPFGIGPRECVGESLAKMELFLFLTHLLHRFNLRPPAGESLDNVKPTYGLVRKPGNYKICFEPRE